MDLKIENLHKSYSGKPVLNGINIEIKPNEIVGLLGPNGSGKSTLIKVITDLLKIDEGSIRFDGKPISNEIRSRISYLPDQSALNPAWKVKDAIAFYADFYPEFSAERAGELCLKMGLPKSQEIKAMSKGMQEKLQLILTMSRKADLYILDEPLGGVDPTSRDEILDTILSNFDDGASMLLSTHLVHDVERILDRVLFLKEGRIVLDKQAEDLRLADNQSIEEIYKEKMACL